MQRDDKVLIEEILGGNQKAFTILVNKHRESVYHVIFKIVKDREEARDLVQDTFIKVFNSLSSYRPEFRFTTWLYKIAANCSIDYLRRRKIQALSLDEKIQTKYGELSFEVADWSYNPEIELSAKQKGFSIDQAIKSLPKKYRDVIVYRHQNDKSYQEIAEILKVPIGTVKARIFRGRELLKKKLRSLR